MKLFLGLFLFVQSAFCEEMTEVSGVIREAQCNVASGRGIVRIENRKGNKVEAVWLKVISARACGEKVRSEIFLDGASRLSEIAARNSMASKYYEVTTLVMRNGFVVDIDESKMQTIDIQPSFFENLFSFGGKTETIHIGAAEANNWFFGL